MAPKYIQWTILTLLYVALWKIPLISQGLIFQTSSLSRINAKSLIILTILSI